MAGCFRLIRRRSAEETRDGLVVGDAQFEGQRLGQVHGRTNRYGGLDRENLDRVIDEHLAKGNEVEDLVIGRNPLPG